MALYSDFHIPFNTLHLTAFSQNFQLFEDFYVFLLEKKIIYLNKIYFNLLKYHVWSDKSGKIYFNTGLLLMCSNKTQIHRDYPGNIDSITQPIDDSFISS